MGNNKLVSSVLESRGISLGKFCENKVCRATEKSFLFDFMTLHECSLILTLSASKKLCKALVNFRISLSLVPPLVNFDLLELRFIWRQHLVTNRDREHQIKSPGHTRSQFFKPTLSKKNNIFNLHKLHARPSQ